MLKKLNKISIYESLFYLIDLLLIFVVGILHKANKLLYIVQKLPIPSEYKYIQKYTTISLGVILLIALAVLFIYLLLTWILPLIFSTIILHYSKATNIEVKRNRVKISILYIIWYIPPFLINIVFANIFNIAFTLDIDLLLIFLLIAANIALAIVRVIILIKFIFYYKNEGSI